MAQSPNVTVWSGEPLSLGEGPLTNHLRGSLVWFDINGRGVYERRFDSHTTRQTELPLMPSAAGLLDGKRATTQWSAMNLLAAYGAIPVDERVVTDGKIMTGAGVSAGIDMALTLLSEVSGEDHAQFVQLMTEYDPQPRFDAGSLDKTPDAVRERAEGLFS